ncbi:MAG TPA: NADPH-dependent F420 reductase [Blastocatellia bacterium]|nr:NADPH-dependent F420 reductase [Blastocatellia bacterium]
MNIGELKVGFLGGTGPEGRGLALRWAKAGARVTVGSRSSDRAATVAGELNQVLGASLIKGADNTHAISTSDFVILTVPFEHAASTIATYKGDFRTGTVLIDTTVPVSFEKGRPQYIELPEGSGSEHLRALLNENTEFVAAFKTIPAHLLSELGDPLDCDDFVAGGSPETRARVIDALSHLDGLRPIDAGGLDSARILERMTLLAIRLNRRYKVKTARYRIVGV